MVKAVRKVLLFDAERKKLCAWMDSEHIWYLPLKGIILKDYYPSVGMRQMSDNDILFDADAWERVEKHMISDGYKAEAGRQGGTMMSIRSRPSITLSCIAHSMARDMMRAGWSIIVISRSV